MSRLAHIENVATLVVMGATMIGLYAFGAGGHSFWALAMMLSINYPDKKSVLDTQQGDSK